MTKLIPFLVGQVKTILIKSDIAVLCIDGPTAAGKTILADNLGKELEKNLKINVEFFRLDWTLLSREERQKDLINLMQNENDFELEGELHMNLNIFHDFLKKIHNLKDNNFTFKKK